MNSLDLNDLPFLKEESLRAYRWLLAEYPEIANQNILSDKNKSSNEENQELQSPQKKDKTFEQKGKIDAELIEFPIRWTMEKLGQKFEWVVSEMGSITLRLGGLEGNRRNPAPIFYLSLRKSEEEKFHWTDPEGNLVPFPNPSILIEIQNRIRLYLDSI
ncbi:LIC_13241 domain-containing protein [Leptospira brenneri]|uniref:Uncharacterized protein n=1 Tax=Leptospira brenneri TaxID=2023182 RepID=A0A2M9Y4X5_9LEPT|nr:hypothetical protein [Leptospira brenneri]PJZ46597.1 hypothetical protein CH361_05850 [Leptospira brenneri]TGK96705.1 hypothetical protein EHQ30_08950 [Leptospira brenneri]